MNKSQLRQIFKQRRGALSIDQIQIKSKLITDNFIQNLLPKISDFNSKKPAFYLAANNEVDTKYLMEYFAFKSEVLALPRISENSLGLIFKAYKIDEKLEKNPLFTNIFEPKAENKTIIPNLIFVPLLAFDKNCNRLGMGKGFYDFTIEKIRKSKQNILFIGLGYDHQLCEKIPTDKNDQSLDFIVSESNIFSSK